MSEAAELRSCTHRSCLSFGVRRTPVKPFGPSRRTDASSPAKLRDDGRLSVELQVYRERDCCMAVTGQPARWRSTKPTSGRLSNHRSGPRGAVSRFSCVSDCPFCPRRRTSRWSACNSSASCFIRFCTIARRMTSAFGLVCPESLRSGEEGATACSKFHAHRTAGVRHRPIQQHRDRFAEAVVRESRRSFGRLGTIRPSSVQ